VITQMLRPATLDEAVSLKNSDIAVIAGGTDLVPMYREGAVAPDQLLDLSRIGELRPVSTADGVIVIGALARASEVSLADLGAHQSVAEGAGLIGSVQTRNMATVGGNVCRSSPAGDTLAPILACSGVVVARSAAGERQIPATGFFRGPGQNTLDPGELLVRVELPAFRGASGYARSTVRKAMDLATVGVAVALKRVAGSSAEVSVCVAVGGAGPVPLLLSQDGPWASVPLDDVDAVVPAVDEALQALICPIDDVRASEWYRRRAVSVLLRRVLATTVARLNESERHES
jgi:CO/xanthine dehydrogenase FAD-binding subunit